MTAAIVIYPDGAVTELATLPGLVELQRMVGGYIECVPVLDQGLCGWINEEGKLHGLGRNPAATMIVRLFEGDWIAGPMVVTGPVDDEGENTPLNADMRAALMERLA